MPDIAAQRRHRILELTSRRGIVAVRELAGELGVSEMSIRRDLRILTGQGALRRTHGGAMSLMRPAVDFPYDERQRLQIEAKNAIGRAAADLVSAGDTIFMSSGTTVAAMAPYLRGRPRVTVVTNSVRVIQELIDDGSITVLASGGVASAATGGLVGPLAERTLERMRVRRAFLGTTGITEDGVCNSSPEEAAIQERMAARAGETYVLADHTKFRKLALSIALDLDRVHAVITDAAVAADDAAWLRGLGVEVVEASMAEGAGPSREDRPSDHRIGCHTGNGPPGQTEVKQPAYSDSAASPHGSE